MSVPMRLPCTDPVVPAMISTAAPPLAEMTLRSELLVPPRWTFREQVQAAQVVAKRGDAGGVGADATSCDRHSPTALEVQPPASVAGQHAPSDHGRQSTFEARKINPIVAVAQIDGAGDVRADVAPFDDERGGVGAVKDPVECESVDDETADGVGRQLLEQ